MGIWTNWTRINEENVICNVCNDDWNTDYDGGKEDALLRRENIQKSLKTKGKT